MAIAVVIVTGALAASAIANRMQHQDRQGDVQVSCDQPACPPPFEELTERDVDIVKASAGQSGESVLVHTVEVAGTILEYDLAGTDPRVNLFISTDSDRDSEFIVYHAFSDGKFGVYKYTKNGLRRTGKAVVMVRDEKATFQFRERSIGSPRSYGWAFSTSHFEFPDSESTDSVLAEDRIPSGKGYLKHRQGRPQ